MKRLHSENRFFRIFLRNPGHLTGLLILILSVCSFAQDEYEWVQLFNGEDLDGWDFKITGQQLNVDPRNTLKISDGILHVDYSDYSGFSGEFGHFARDEVYSHYIYAVETRFIGEQTPGGPNWAFRNNGIMIHSQSMESMNINQDFPTSVEAQIIQRGSDAQPVAALNLCNGSSGTTAAERANCGGSDASVPLTDKDDWFRAEVLVLADSVAKFILNGDTVGVFTQFKLSNGGAPLGEGRIALQMESHPTDFRKIEMVNLKGCMDETAINYKDYFLADDPESCEYGKAGCTDSSYLEYDSTATVSDPEACENLSTLEHRQFKRVYFNSTNISLEVPLEGKHQLMVHDVNGSTVYETNGVGPQTYFLRPILPNGIHFIVLEWQGYRITQKALGLNQ